MALMRWDPIGEIAAIRDRMDRFLEETLPRLDPRWQRSRGEWTPAVDIIRDEECIIVRAEIPGVDASDVSVQVEGDLLTLQGERRFGETVGREAYKRVERSHGPFKRSFTLPQGVEPEKVRATLRNGVLEVTLPLSGERPPKTINVRAE